ncbi:MAG: hypothetical protein GY951_07310 [Psychromonas sp.]|nr:hypothetical protein [Psychromonas sp.]
MIKNSIKEGAKMDPITLAIVAALGKLSENVIKDAYEALKTAIAHKCGVNADLTKAVEGLEKKPTSAGRKETLREEVADAKVDQDSEILELARNLLNKIDELEGQAEGSTVINQNAGDNAIQISQSRDVNIKQKR